MPGEMRYGRGAGAVGPCRVSQLPQQELAGMPPAATLPRACDRALVLLPTRSGLSSCWLAGSLEMKGALDGRGCVLGAAPSAEDEELQPGLEVRVFICPGSCTFSQPSCLAPASFGQSLA